MDKNQASHYWTIQHELLDTFVASLKDNGLDSGGGIWTTSPTGRWTTSPTGSIWRHFASLPQVLQYVGCLIKIAKWGRDSNGNLYSNMRKYRKAEAEAGFPFGVNSSFLRRPFSTDRLPQRQNMARPSASSSTNPQANQSIHMHPRIIVIWVYTWCLVYNSIGAVHDRIGFKVSLLISSHSTRRTCNHWIAMEMSEREPPYQYVRHVAHSLSRNGHHVVVYLDDYCICGPDFDSCKTIFDALVSKLVP